MVLEYIIKEKQLNIVRVNSKVEDITAKLEERIQPYVEQWLCGFYDADFVVTDSFHACVFSIIFNKPFIVCGNKKRGSARFLSLLSSFNLLDRYITDGINLSEVLDKTIDWSEINKKKENLKSFSWSFLNQSLIYK